MNLLVTSDDMAADDDHPERSNSQAVPRVTVTSSTGNRRREFLRAGVSGAFVLGAASVLGADEFLAGETGTVSVTTALVREDPADPWSVTERTREVPAEWYEAVSAARRLNDRLARARVGGYLGSAVAPGSLDSGTARLSVEVSLDVEGVRELLDDVIDGIRVDTEALDDVDERGTEWGLADPRHLESTADGVAPGGVACETPTSIATLGPALYDRDERETYFVTAEHAFEDGATGEAVGLTTEADGRIDLGTVAHAYPEEDVALLESAGTVVPVSTIDAVPSVDVRGQFTRWGLAVLAAEDAELEKVGAMTGHTTGEIHGIDANMCFTDSVCRRGQLRWGEESDLTDGDSGSVSYHPDPEAPEDGVLIAGFNNARTWWPGQSYVWGIAAHYLTERYGYQF